MTERRESDRPNHEHENTGSEKMVRKVGGRVLRVTELPPEEPEEVRKRDGIKPGAVGDRFMAKRGDGSRQAPKFIGGPNPQS